MVPKKSVLLSIYYKMYLISGILNIFIYFVYIL